MRFGLAIPNNWGLENPQEVIDIGVEAERLGYDSVWVSHHVLHVGNVLARLGGRPYYDALTILTYLAAVTERVRLGASVLVLPYLNPIVLAKSLATLDVLSKGRITVGVGAGAVRPESDALGSDFTRRGAYTDESIAIMKELWTEDDPTFEGEFYSFSEVKFSPKPTQQPHPPIWIGGRSRAAIRRTARLGDGWHPNPSTVDEVADLVGYLGERVEAAGRSMSDVAVSVRCELDVLDSTAAEQRAPMIGTVDQLLATIDSFARLGVSEIVFSVSSGEAGRVRGIMEMFADKVMPRAER